MFVINLYFLGGMGGTTMPLMPISPSYEEKGKRGGEGEGRRDVVCVCVCVCVAKGLMAFFAYLATNSKHFGYKRHRS